MVKGHVVVRRRAWRPVASATTQCSKVPSRDPRNGTEGNGQIITWSLRADEAQTTLRYLALPTHNTTGKVRRLYLLQLDTCKWSMYTDGQ